MPSLRVFSRCSFVFFLIFFFFDAAANNDTTALRKDLKLLDSFFGYRTNLVFPNQGTIESTRESEIKISKDELNKIIGMADSARRKSLLRFVLCHEFSHQIQFYRYRDSPNYWKNDLQTKTLIEAQADLIGGFSFTLLSPELYQSVLHGGTSADTMLVDIFRLLDQLGLKENVLGHHPSNSDRWLAFKTGVGFGLSYLLDQELKRAVSNNEEIPFTVEEYQEIFEFNSRFMDMTKDEDVLDWSYRQACKIVNYDKSLATNLILVTPYEERVWWDERNSNPYCYYNLAYRNIGEEALKVEMEVYVSHVKKDESNFRAVHKKHNVNHYKFVLPPGETYRISDSLNWEMQENGKIGWSALKEGYMPRLNFPGPTNSEALYSCISPGEVGPKDQIQQPYEDFYLYQEPQSINLGIFIMRIVNGARTDPWSLLTGVGALQGNYDADYNCSVQWTDDSETHAIYNEEHKVKTLTSFPGLNGDPVGLQERFKGIKQSLARLYPDANVSFVHNDKHEQLKMMHPDFTLQMDLYHIADSGSPIHSLTLLITPR